MAHAGRPGHRVARPLRGRSAARVAHYAGQLDVRSETSYALAPEVFGRSGAVAIAALLLVPFAAFAWRRRWAAYVLGGSLAVFLITLVPWLFTPFSDLVSISQSRRVAGFLPFAFALAGGLTVLAGRVRGLVLALALAAGIVFQLAWPGDFGYRLDEGGPAVVTWIAAAARSSGWRSRRSGARTGRSRVRRRPSRRLCSCCRSPCTGSASGAPRRRVRRAH